MRRLASHAYTGFSSGVASPVAVLALKAIVTVTVIGIVLRTLGLG